MSAHPSHWVHRPELRAAVIAKLSGARQGHVQSAATRAKRAATLRLKLPEVDVRAIVALYARMGLDGVAQAAGYHRKVVRRVLAEAGVAIRPAGFQPGNALGQMQKGRRKSRGGRDV